MGNPERLGRYEIVRHLANGGMAQVLLARTTGIGGFERYVVVKRIHSEQAKNQTFVQMFLDEARLSAMLHHGNVVQVHEVGEDNGTIFFAMEYVHGEDVRRLLMELSKRREKTPLEHVIAIVSATADALHHAHEQHGSDGKPLGLVHRDVTPANIIVGYDGIVKVVDFGIAKAAIRTSETQAGMLKGKVAYMAPEQCTGKQVDRRSDVFSLGVVLYELACVKRLFKGDNEFLTMSAIVDGKIPPPSQYRADLPKGLEKIILKALAMKPEDRYQSAGEMGAELERFASAIGLRPTPKALAAYMKQKFGTKREPWLADDEPEITLTADFDGSASGVVSVPTAAIENLAIPQEIAPTPSAPIMRMRKKAATGQEKPQPPPPFAAKKPSSLYEVPSVKRKSEPIVAVTPPRDPTPIPIAPSRKSAPLGVALVAEPKTRAQTPSIVVDDALGASPLAKPEDGWGASGKEVTPSLGALAPVFPDGVPPAATVAAEPEPDELAPAMPVAVPNTPRWKKAIRDKRVQIGGAVSALVLLIFITHCGSKKSSMVPRPSSEVDVVAPAPAAAAPAPVAAAPAPAPDPTPTPEPTPAVEPAPAKPVPDAAAPQHAKAPAKPAPAKQPAKTTSSKRPKPKFLF